ncbi:S24/S26 family peptidase [Curtobacterium flaccumfaciens]|nr:S24/S26 family peptidase [Curtobacterium flaccumfaciens]
MKLYGTNVTTTKDLAANVNLTVEQGTGGGFGSCSGFTPAATGSSLYSGTVAGFGAASTNYATGVGSWTPDRHRVRDARLPRHLHGLEHRAEHRAGRHRSPRLHLGGPEQLSRGRGRTRPVRSLPATRPRSKAVMSSIAVHGGPAPHAAVRDAVEWGRVVVASLARGVVATLLGLALWAAAPALIGWQPTTVMTGLMEPRIVPGDVVVSRPVGSGEIAMGKVLLADDPDQADHMRMHRYVQDGSRGTMVTKGDANPQQDSTPIERSRGARHRLPAHPCSSAHRSGGSAPASGAWSRCSHSA